MDAYKLLRSQVIRRTREKGWNTVMITSPTAGDGKTVTAVNLALTFAKEFSQTVLLVDANLRHQDVYRMLGLPGDAGLVDHLLDARPLTDLIVWPGIEKLTVISGGRAMADSAELLSSPRMAELVGQMKTRYPDRYILFDTAPVLQGADALSFAAIVDAFIMVVQWGRTRLDDIRRAMELIPREKFIGFALNRCGPVSVNR
jgi:non-specific protein-tyrosine kinase